MKNMLPQTFLVLVLKQVEPKRHLEDMVKSKPKLFIDEYQDLFHAITAAGLALQRYVTQSYGGTPWFFV